MLFRNYSSRLGRAVSTTGQAGGLARQTAKGVEKMFMMRKLPRNLDMQVAYLNSRSEDLLQYIWKYQN